MFLATVIARLIALWESNAIKRVWHLSALGKLIGAASIGLPLFLSPSFLLGHFDLKGERPFKLKRRCHLVMLYSRIGLYCRFKRFTPGEGVSGSLFDEASNH